MKLTIEQKLEALKEVRRLPSGSLDIGMIKYKDSEYGLCNVLGWVCEDIFGDFLVGEFPLIIIRPANSPDGYWWTIRTIEGYNQRMKAVDILIKHFEKQLKTERPTDNRTPQNDEYSESIQTNLKKKL